MERRSSRRRRRRSHQVALQVTRGLAPRASFRGCMGFRLANEDCGHVHPHWIIFARPPLFLLKNCAFGSQRRERRPGRLELWSVFSNLYSVLSILQTSLCGERNRRCVSYTDGRNGRAGVATESETMDLFRCVWAWVMGRAREPVP